MDTNPVSIFKIPSKCEVAKLSNEQPTFSDPKKNCSFYECAARAADQERCCSYSDKKSYFINYGEKYCQKFISEGHRLTSKGRAWLDKTLSCLQGSLQSGCNEQKKCSDCVSIRKLACYVSSGLCDLDLHDQVSISKTVDGKDFFTGESFAQVASVASSCAHYNILVAAKGYYAWDPIRNKDLKRLAQPISAFRAANKNTQQEVPYRWSRDQNRTVNSKVFVETADGILVDTKELQKYGVIEVK
jgi:hypothetical protein